MRRGFFKSRLNFCSPRSKHRVVSIRHASVSRDLHFFCGHHGAGRVVKYALDCISVTIAHCRLLLDIALTASFCYLTTIFVRVRHLHQTQLIPETLRVRQFRQLSPVDTREVERIHDSLLPPLSHARVNRSRNRNDFDLLPIGLFLTYAHQRTRRRTHCEN